MPSAAVSAARLRSSRQCRRPARIIGAGIAIADLADGNGIAGYDLGVEAAIVAGPGAPFHISEKMDAIVASDFCQREGRLLGKQPAAAEGVVRG